MSRAHLVRALLSGALVTSTAAGADAQQATAASAQAAPAPSAADVARARRALRATTLTDGHNDLPWRIR